MLTPFNDDTVALVYGRQKGNQATKFSETQILEAWFPESSNSNQDHPFCNNANAAIRRSLWEQRPYNETLPGLEDLDWASWAIAQGHTISYVAEAEVVHVHDESARMVYNRYRREAMALKRIRPQEKFDLLDFLRLYVSNVINDWTHASREGVLGDEFFAVLGFRLMQFWGTYRGFSLSGSLTGELKKTFYYPRRVGIPTNSGKREVVPIDYSTSAEPNAVDNASAANKIAGEDIESE
jgi:hypothetical protein